MNLYPAIDLRGGMCVRLEKGNFSKETVYSKDPGAMARRFAEAGARTIHVVDLDGALAGKSENLSAIKAILREGGISIEVGGGISTMEDIRAVLMAGADKTSLNTAAVMTPELIQKGAEAYGAQCMVLAVDAKKKTSSGWEVYIHGGRTATGLDVLEWVRKAVTLGAGEILLTSMDADGTQDGFDLDLTRAVAEEVPVPVIASGGAGKLEDFYRVLTEGKADAALAASVFHYGTFRIKEVKDYLSRRGVVVRR